MFDVFHRVSRSLLRGLLRPADGFSLFLSAVSSSHPYILIAEYPLVGPPNPLASLPPNPA
jgi:hypothetical protein